MALHDQRDFRTHRLLLNGVLVGAGDNINGTRLAALATVRVIIEDGGTGAVTSFGTSMQETANWLKMR